MKVKIGVSNRHVHLTLDDFKTLFGDVLVLKKKDLVQPGQYASNLTVDIKTDKNIIKNVRVIMPCRSYTQVELSRTDCFYLGIDPPIKTSGDLNGASLVSIIGSCGQVAKECAIIANRHIHISREDRKKFSLEDIDKVAIRVGKCKRALLYDVYIKEGDNSLLECHLDLDDSNANFINNGDEGEIFKY